MAPKQQPEDVASPYDLRDLLAAGDWIDVDRTPTSPSSGPLLAAELEESVAIEASIADAAIALSPEERSQDSGGHAAAAVAAPPVDHAAAAPMASSQPPALAHDGEEGEEQPIYPTPDTPPFAEKDVEAASPEERSQDSGGHAAAAVAAPPPSHEEGTESATDGQLLLQPVEVPAAAAAPSESSEPSACKRLCRVNLKGVPIAYVDEGTKMVVYDRASEAWFSIVAKPKLSSEDWVPWTWPEDVEAAPPEERS